jgi:hypothetical protein
MAKLNKVFVRYESDVNTEWKLEFAGSVQEFYSIDGESPRFTEDDRKVYDRDPVLGDFLWHILDIHPADPDAVSELELDGNLRLITRVDEPLPE